MNSVKPDRFSFQPCWLFLLCLCLAGAGCGGDSGNTASDRYSVLGKVMAEKTAQLCNGKGSVVLLVSENDVDRATPYGLAYDAFRKALGNSVVVSATEVVPTPKALGPGSEPLSAAKFAELLQKHATADYLVSFIRVPALTGQQIAQLPSPRPQVVAVIASPQLTPVMFSSKVLCLAAVPKPETQDAVPAGLAQEMFDACYQLVTPEMVSLLAR